MPATSKDVQFSVGEYFRLSTAGVFGNRRVELINGRIYPMHAQAHPHRWTISRLSRLLQRAYLPEQFWVVVQGTLSIAKSSAPDPDLHLFDVPEGTPDAGLPIPFLVIEVSDSTYRRDSKTKLRLYARAGVPEYWIVNLKRQKIEVRRDPVRDMPNDSGGAPDWRYATLTEFASNETLPLPKLNGQSTTADAILPP